MLKAILQHRNTAGVCKLFRNHYYKYACRHAHIHKSNYIDAGTDTDLDTNY